MKIILCACCMPSDTKHLLLVSRILLRPFILFIPYTDAHTMQPMRLRPLIHPNIQQFHLAEQSIFWSVDFSNRVNAEWIQHSRAVKSETFQFICNPGGCEIPNVPFNYHQSSVDAQARMCVCVRAFINCKPAHYSDCLIVRMIKICDNKYH